MCSSNRLFGIPYMTVVSVFWMSVSASSCPGNSITIWDSVTGQVQCQDCLVCPAAQGLSVDCGDIISPQTPIVCKPCELGRTYSSKSEAGACKSCMNCGEYRETISPCTLTSEAVCGTNCKLGAYPEDMLSMCRPCSACCNDTDDIIEPECQVPGVPKNKQCSELRSEKCSKVIANVSVSTRVLDAEANLSASSLATLTKVQVSTPVTEHFKKDSASAEDVSSSHGKMIGVAIGVPLMILVLVALILIVKKRRTRQACKKPGNNDVERLDVQGTIRPAKDKKSNQLPLPVQESEYLTVAKPETQLPAETKV
ncbi:tumor necrosis factor receptor superfamily member 10B-like [Pocillopora verrucosa]|uniref:tumor necrosis factor receptor superfamily member 10B-like n=1 Tax=Pocillopora verrucosa TaxID=203993 RepID=UPI0033415877